MPEPHDYQAFALPCAECQTAVTIRSRNPHAFIDRWLDGELQVLCSLHRIKPAPAAA